MKYLLIIILLTILIMLLHVYLNIDEKTLENFSPFLGLIEFHDKESNEKLGEYSEKWKTDNVENKEVTVIKINREPWGDTGETGTSSDVGIYEGRIDIESIDTDKLEINVKELDMIADRINIKNKLCIGDKCLDVDLINKIKYSNSQNADLENVKNELEELKRINTSLNEKIIELRREKETLESPDKSFISSINKDTPDNNLEISGNSLEFSGNRVNFENEFCVGNFCLTKEDMEKISEHPQGEPGNPGMCADRV